MTLTKYGWKQWSCITVVLAIPLVVFIWLGWWIGVIAVVALWLALVSFFRNPWRRIPTGLETGTMLSPADGTISAIERVDHHGAIGGEALIIRIFLSVLNVHINRAPCACTLKEMIYTPGKFLDARTAESAQVNECNLLIFDNNGEPLGVRQVSGKIARHIVCPLKAGDSLTQGQQFGMIKYGSTTELILPRPDDVETKVNVGDKVKAGVTVFCVLNDSAIVTP
ncbi:MAG: phosphatidylserine decarboxylase family protein [Planctomycetes bacterium]|nr:phosphatidylserine decarboxylase family protein [Planctomycetota bacterium]